MGAVPFLAIDYDLCDGCGGCVAVCGPLALQVMGQRVVYDEAACTGCGDCVLTCPLGALREGGRP